MFKKNKDFISWMMYLITNKPLNRGRTILLTYHNMTNMYTRSILYIPIILFIRYGKSGNVWRHCRSYLKWAVNCDEYNIIAYATRPEKINWLGGRCYENTGLLWITIYEYERFLMEKLIVYSPISSSNGYKIKIKNYSFYNRLLFS